MELLQLPYFNSADSLQTAIDKVANNATPGVVIKYKGYWLLYSIRTVFNAFSDGLDYFGELDQSAGIKLLQAEEREVHTLFEKMKDLPSQSTLGSKIEPSGLRFALIVPHSNEDRGIANVIIDSVPIFKVLAGLNVICVCTGPGKHIYESKNGKDMTGQQCEICEHAYVCTVSL